MTELIFAFWFFLPSFVANMSPIFANNIPALNRFNTPLDKQRTFRGKRILGDNKTLRGIGAGVVGGLVASGIQMMLYINISSIRTMSELVDYSEPRVFLLGAALGLGALIGDSAKSFFKRQLGIQSGHGWFPFDQTDFIVGSALFAIPFGILTLQTFVLGIVVALVLHPTANVLGWLLKMKPRPF